MTGLTADEMLRFHLNIPRGEGCWEWSGERNNYGYGRFTIYRNGRRRRLLAHKTMLTLILGREPNGDTKHSCDNPPCCRPDHLSEGSRSENLLEAQARGRANYDGLFAHTAATTRAVHARIAQGIKTCSVCHATKPFAAFARNRVTADGHAYRCKACVASVRREREAA